MTDPKSIINQPAQLIKTVIITDINLISGQGMELVRIGCIPADYRKNKPAEPESEAGKNIQEVLKMTGIIPPPMDSTQAPRSHFVISYAQQEEIKFQVGQEVSLRFNILPRVKDLDI